MGTVRSSRFVNLDGTPLNQGSSMAVQRQSLAAFNDTFDMLSLPEGAVIVVSTLEEVTSSSPNSCVELEYESLVHI